MNDDRRQFDIAIVGGGMVGASMAAALESMDYRCVLIEAGSFRQSPPASYDERAIALSQGSVAFLDHIGLWPLFQSEAAAIRQVHVSERGGMGVVRLKAERYGVPALGHVVPASALGQAFVRFLPGLRQTTVLEKTRVESLEQSPEHIRLLLTGGADFAVEAKLVIAADGVNSGVRRSLGIGIDESDYGHTAVVFNLSAERAPEGIAYERFTTEGPLALLPMSKGRFGVVWTIDREREAEVADYTDDQVLAEIQARIGYRAGRLSRLGERHYYPLKRVRAKEQTRPRLCVIGNAAHSLHPIGGQGFNLGLRDVMGLTQILGGKPSDPGDRRVTRRYEQARLGDQDAVAGFTHGLANLFGVPGFVPLHLRSAGLAVTEMLPPLKRWFARRAMGVDGPVPRFNR